MNRLSGNAVIITGGGNGIGKASCRLFANEGANVVVADRDARSAEIVAAQILDSGGNAVAAIGDVSSEERVETIVGECLAQFGKVDALFNCAGGGSSRDGPVTELDIDEFWRTIRVDLFGTLLMCRRVIPEMAAAGRGSIVNISSLRAIVGTAGADAYTAAKGGVLAMSRAMAMQWADKGIRVNVLAPGVVLTPRVAEFIEPDNPIYRKSLLGPSDPIDVARLALFLASDESRKITGAVMRIDGGASVY